MRNIRRNIALLLVTTLICGYSLSSTMIVKAEEATESEAVYNTGFEEAEKVILDGDEPLIVDDEKYSHVDVSNSAYSQYTNDYFYNQLSSVEKNFYNEMYMACQNLLTSNADAYAYSSGGQTKYFTSAVNFSGLTEAQAVRVALIMGYSNPQFYFISGGYASSSTSFALGVYSEFASGSTRAWTTATLFSVVEQDLAKVNAQSTVYAKQKMAHDLVCQRTRYDLNSSVNQGAYSVFVNGVSVCAGYSEAFAMLCNAAGITTLCVTSAEHEWNLINLNGSWYFVDCTWDDGDGDVYDSLFLDCGTITMSGNDYNGYHAKESIWDGIYPAISAGDYDVSSASTIATQVMYRLYNPNSGEHFYTADTAERDHIISVGWRYEGIAWTAPVSSGTPVYRLYNPNAGDHHYTTDASEKDHLVSVGWRYEGVGWYSADSQTTPLYRLYNPNAVAGAHHYTVDYNEVTWLTSLGWKYEGLAWYGM